jgi:ATP-binding cassette, subfamily B, multidrug efflux pump
MANKTYPFILSHLYKTLDAYRPVFPFFAANVGRVAAGVVSLLIVDGLQLLIPQQIKRAVDLLVTGKVDPGHLVSPAVAIAGIAFLIAGFRYVWRYFIFGHSRLVEKGLRNRLYSHLQSLSPSFYRRMRTGDVMARAINDINAVRMAAGMGLVALVDGIVLGLASVGFMISISPALTLISLTPAPFVIFGTRILTRRMSTGFESVQRCFSGLTETVREAFSGIRVTKAYHRREWQEKRLRREASLYLDANMALVRSLALFIPMMAVAANAGLAALIWFGGRLTILGTITTGDFVAFISYLTLLTWPMMAMGWVFNLMQRGAASMRRINDVLEESADIADPPSPVGMTPKGGITFRSVTAVYPGERGLALEDIDLDVEDGETVAVVGRVGSGKTTLMNLIPRLMDAAAGSVRFGGIDVRSLPLAALRGRIGFVTQDVFVFSDTVRNNILFGAPAEIGDGVESALEDAGLLEEMMALEHGLDTMLGERGLSLSGGQRQRLTIARALFRNPQVLLLDDALSMVDGITESGIINRILSQRASSTTVMVSHRPSSIRRADRIVVLNAGRVAGIGTHEDLVASCDIYKELYERERLQEELEEMGNPDAR